MSADPDEIAEVPDDDAVASRLLEKLRAFVGSLDDDERAVMAALLAPGVASAYRPEPATDDRAGAPENGHHAEADVIGFGMPTVAWQPERLPDSLTDRIKDQHLRIEFD